MVRLPDPRNAFSHLRRTVCRRCPPCWESIPCIGSSILAWHFFSLCVSDACTWYPRLFVPPDHLTDCFVAYTVDAPDPAVATNLLRAPVHAQLRDNVFVHLIRQPVISDSGLLPFIAFSLRCFPVVDAGFLHPCSAAVLCLSCFCAPLLRWLSWLLKNHFATSRKLCTFASRLNASYLFLIEDDISI